nr:hypothetical protein [Tanacetum cinerariifolium]
MEKAKEIDLSVEIQIISSENVRNYQNIIIKRHLLEDLREIATKMKRRRQRTKSVLWLKLPIRLCKIGLKVMAKNKTIKQAKIELENEALELKDKLSRIEKGTSSHQHDDDDDEVETSQASTPSPTTYLNSLHPLDYQNYHVLSSSEQTDETLFARQTTLLNQMQRMHEEMRGGFKSFGKALKEVFSKKKK